MASWSDIAIGIVVGGVLLYFTLMALNVFFMGGYVLIPILISEFWPWIFGILGFVVITYILEEAYLKNKKP